MKALELKETPDDVQRVIVQCERASEHRCRGSHSHIRQYNTRSDHGGVG